MQQSQDEGAFSEMEDLLQLVRSITQTRVTSFHRIPPHIYGMIFKALFPEKELNISNLKDVVDVMKNDLSEYGPPQVCLGNDSLPNFAHNIQILTWAKEVSSKLNMRFNVVPEEQLTELKLEDLDQEYRSLTEHQTYTEPSEANPVQKLLHALKTTIQDKTEQVMQLEKVVKEIQKKILETKGAKRRAEVSKYLSTLS